MKKISIFIGLILMLFTSCQNRFEYDYVHEYYLENRTDKVIFYSVKSEGIDYSSSYFRLDPFETKVLYSTKLHEECYDKCLNESELNAGFENIVFKLGEEEYIVTKENIDGPLYAKNYYSNGYLGHYKRRSKNDPVIYRAFSFTLDDDFFQSLK